MFSRRHSDLVRHYSIWDVMSDASISKPLQRHTHKVFSAVYSPDGTRIASGSGDDNSNLGCRNGCTNRGTSSGTFSHLVNCLFPLLFQAPGQDNSKLRPGTLHRHTYHISSDTYSHRLRLLGQENWDAMLGTPVARSLRGHSRPISSVAFSPGDTHIISGLFPGARRFGFGMPCQVHPSATCTGATSV